MTLKIWNGTAFVDPSDVRYGATLLVPSGVYYWDGTQFVKAWPTFVPHDPETTNYTTPGTFTYTLPAWFRAGIDYVDRIACGAGGGGAGYSGGWASGLVGSASSVSGSGVTTLTPTPGNGGSGTGASSNGGSPGPKTYNGTTYPGGTGALAAGSGNGADGGNPGAGGGSGNFFGNHSSGAAGAWAFDTIQPTGNLTVVVGAGGVGGFHGTGTTYGGDGGDAVVHLVARQNV